MPAKIRAATLALVAAVVLPVAPSASAGSFGSSGSALRLSFRASNMMGAISLFNGASAGVSTMPPDADVEQPAQTWTACVELIKMVRVWTGWGYLYQYKWDAGCGRLKVTADELHDMMKVSGSVRSYVTGGKITVSGTFRAKGVALPYLSGGLPGDFALYVDPASLDESVHVGTYTRLESGLRRAMEGNLTIKSSELTVSKQKGTGYAYRNASVRAGI